MALTATGPHGELRVGGRAAAKLGKWVLTSSDEGVSIVTAPTADVDEYWLWSSGIKELRLSTGSKQWRWREVEVGYGGSTMTITVTGKPTIY